MPSDNEPCGCDHVGSHSSASKHSRAEGKKDDDPKGKSKSTSPKVKGNLTKKKGRGKKKEEISADTLLAKIAELEKAGKAETEVPPVAALPLPVPKVGLHIPADLRDRFLAQVASTNRERVQIQVHQAKISQLQKDRDEIMANVARVEEKRQKLDDLCKQLQARNREILEGVRERGEEEQAKRKELSEKFSATITEITTRMEQQQQERLKMATENDQLRLKIEGMKETIISREEAFKTLHDKKDAEVQHLQDKLKDCEAKGAAEEQKFVEWREGIESQGTAVDELRTQLQSYSGKFEKFQTTLTKSNPVFMAYKVEMDKVGKRIRALELENQQLRLRVAKADIQIVDLSEQRAKDMPKALRLEEENAALQAIAKQLTVERARLKGLQRLPSPRADLDAGPSPPS